jgi:dTDP-4-dehydrorhamnose 3,5-epimerase
MGLFNLEAMHFGGEVKVISSRAFEDERGFFAPSFRADEFAELGLPTKFLQDNHSRSVKNVIRGLHFQTYPHMGKLMRVSRGEAFLVAVNIAVESEDFGKWAGIYASEENRLQMWAPAWYARGFCALSDITDVQYKCTAKFQADRDFALRWNDPTFEIDWPITNPILSERDQNAPTVTEFLCGKLR